MENGATHYIPTASEPGRGPYAASTFSTPAPSTLSTGSTQQSSTQSTGMIDTYYLYSHDGKLMAEYDHSGNAVKYYLYMGSRLIAEYQPDTNKYYYYMSDRINSTRIVTDENGDVVYSEAYGPYGDVQKTWTKNYDPKLKFSGKEREVYSDLDYFGARYYDSNRYRFISVDPKINKDEAMVKPQMWNRYAYCDNNPITFLDPDGLDKILGIHVNTGTVREVEKKSGHAYISMEDTDTGKFETHGLWPTPRSSDVEINREVNPRTGGFSNKYRPEHSRYYRLTPEQQKKYEEFIAAPCSYTYLYNCSNWAADAAKYVVGEELKANEMVLTNWGFHDKIYGTPRKLASSIKEKETRYPTSRENPAEIK